MTTAPETFDVEAFIKDANLPPESATVYSALTSSLTSLS